MNLDNVKAFLKWAREAPPEDSGDTPGRDGSGTTLDQKVSDTGPLATVLRNPTVQNLAKSVFNYQLTDEKNRPYNALGGAAGGAGLGTLLALILGKSPWKGALTGGIGGGAAGYWGPQLAQKLLGRYMTNMVEPFDYSQPGEHLQALADDPLGYLRRAGRAMWHDKPIGVVGLNDPPEGEELEEWGDKYDIYNRKDNPYWDTFSTQPVDPLYRSMFGLDPRYAKDMYVENEETENPDDLEFNPESQMAQRMVDRLKKRLKMSYPEGPPDEHFWLHETPAYGRTHFYPDEEGNIVMRDKWDFGPDPGEKIDTLPDVVRGLVNMLSDPKTVHVNLDSPHWNRSFGHLRGGGDLSRVNVD